MKRAVGWILFFLSIACLSLSAAAQAPTQFPKEDRIYDPEQLLTTSQRQKFRDEIAELEARYDMEIALAFVFETDGSGAIPYAATLLEESGFSLDSMLLLVDFSDREVAVATSGKAQELFSDQSLNRMLDAVAPALSTGTYVDAVREYLSFIDAHLGAEPDYLVHVPFRQRYSAGRILGVSLLCGIVVAGIVAGILVRRHRRSVPAAPCARAYLDDSGMRLIHRTDQFLHTHTTRTKIPKQNSGSGGGGSTVHRSSSGRSFGGASRKF